MDANTLFQGFAGTLNHDASVRIKAEEHLKQASRAPGFLGACLDIIASSEVPDNIKMSASLYFKNKIAYGWNSNEHSGKNELLSYVVDNDEKPVVKDMLLQTMLQCSKQSPNCVRVLKTALTVIINSEYPNGKWDDLLPKSLELLTNNDIDVTYIGLLCLSEIFRTYRWKENDARQNLEMLIQQYFPDFLRYANDNLLIDGRNMNNPKVGELLKLILKIYKFVTYHDLPFTLQRSEFFIPWANLFVAIIQQPLPGQILSISDIETRKSNPWVKCKKWSYANLYRLFQRYASTSLSRKFDYNDFKSTYIEEFLPQLLQLLFQQIEQWGNHTLWLSDESLYYILSFLEQAITQKSTWKLVGPHYSTILKHVIFPLLRPNDDALETFDNDPQEYIHRNLELWDDDYSPDLAAVSLLITAVNKRGKATLQPTLEFIVEVFQANAVDFKNIEMEQAVNIESCLKIFSNIIDRLMDKKSPYASEIETFLRTYVFPLFNSQYGFLRTRVCDICSKLGAIEFKDISSTQIVYEGIMSCLNDSSDCLPINLSAALALQTFILDTHFQEALAPSVVPIMQKLLALSNEFESDAISGVMQEFVEQFSEQLQPFGVELMNTLVQQFLKLAIDLNDAANIDPTTIMSSDEVPDESNKQMAALGILSTIISILLSFENSLEVVRSLEQSFYPAAEFILKNDVEDFYRELCEFVENSTFLLRSVSPITWKILELIGECNRKEDSMVSYYLEDFMLVINNILVYGNDELKKNDFYSNILFEIYQRSNVSDDADLDDLNIVYDFSQKLIVAFGTSLPPAYRELFSGNAVRSIAVERENLKKNIVFGVTAFNVIISNIIYAPLDTLRFLKTHNMFEVFFEIWLNTYLPNYKRTFDIKLSIMALLNILNELQNSNFVEFSLEPLLPKLGTDVLTLLSRFPNAEESLNNKRKEFSSGDFDATKYGAWNDDTYYNDDEDAEDVEDLEKYLSNMNDPGNLKFVDGITFGDSDSFDDLEEDPLSKSLLDDIDIYAFTKTSLAHLQQDVAKYQASTSALSPELQQTLMHIMNM